VGVIPQSLPSITLPSLGLVEQLLPGALGIALMSFTETIAAARAFAKATDPPIKPNRELLATVQPLQRVRPLQHLKTAWRQSDGTRQSSSCLHFQWNGTARAPRC
jgi:hypothetical protein